MEMQVETQSQQINELAAALAKAQKNIGIAVCDKQNLHYRSKYASYAAIRKSCETLLSENGLSIVHIFTTHGDKRAILTQLMHISGQWIRSILVMPQDKETPQGVGSSISYAMRYSLSALLAIPAGEEDDDAEKAEEPYREAAKDEQKSYDKLLDEDEVEEIDVLIGDDMELMNRILSGYRVSKLSQIPAKHFKAIVAKLQAKKEMK